jgi:hypothetical protein
MGKSWSCAYNNIQMLGAYLLTQPPAQRHIFRGLNYVPSLSALQSEIDKAWYEGFDPAGFQQLGVLSGGGAWIGSSEAWALLRFYGLRAKAVRFVTRKAALEGSRKKPGAAAASQPLLIRGPAREVQTVLSAHYWGLSFSVEGEPKTSSSGSGSGSSSSGSSSNPAARSPLNAGQRAMVEWVWAYFTGRPGPTVQQTDSFRPRRSLVVNKPPLFFQRAGHSMTIVGIERQRNAEKGASKGKGRKAADDSARDPFTYMLLILDPAISKDRFDGALGGRHWQAVVKRNMSRLQDDMYDILYVDGECSAEEYKRERNFQFEATFGL